MSFERMVESQIPLREAADFFLKLKYASGVPPDAEELLEAKVANQAGISLPATATGMQKTVEHMPQLQGTAAGQQAKIAFQKAAFSLSAQGHKFDARRADVEKEYALNQTRLLQDFDAADAHVNGKGKVIQPELWNVLRLHTADPTPLMTARHKAYVSMQHKGGKNAWNPLGGALTPVKEEEGGKPGLLGRYGRVKEKKAAGQTLDPETTGYLQQEQDAEQAVGEAEEGYYRQRFAEAAEELQATQAQLQEQQAQVQMLQEQAGQHLQESDQVLQQAQETNAMATETAMQAHGVAAQAIQQNQMQSQELIQQMQLSANMRAAIDEMKQQLMQVAMQPSPPTTTVQQAFDMTAGPGGPGGEMGMEGDPSQDPAMMGEPGAEEVPGAEAGAAPAPAKKPPAKDKPAAKPEKKPAEKAASARMIGGLAGAAVGGGATYLESKSDPKKMQPKIRALEQRKAEGGGFSTSLGLAKARIQEALTDVARQHPAGATMAGAAMGAAQGSALGPALVRLSDSVRNFGKKTAAQSAQLR